MKKIIIPILLLLSQWAHAELFTGDFTLITSTSPGVYNISFLEGTIEEDNGTQYLVMPKLGRTEIISNKSGTEFHAVYMPSESEHDGKGNENFSITLVGIGLGPNGTILCSINRTYGGYLSTREVYILKQGKLKLKTKQSEPSTPVSIPPSTPVSTRGPTLLRRTPVITPGRRHPPQR